MMIRDIGLLYEWIAGIQVSALRNMIRCYDEGISSMINHGRDYYGGRVVDAAEYYYDDIAGINVAGQLLTNTQHDDI